MSQIIGPLLTRPDFSHARLEADMLCPLPQELPAPKADTELLQRIAALETAVLLQSTKLFSPRLGNLNVGDVFSFGHLFAGSNEPIEWQILEKGSDRVLVISKYGLFERQYHSNFDMDTTWETCDLRRWLNEVFHQNAFYVAEQKYILLSKISGMSYFSNGNDTFTYDKIFLMGAEEVEKYFPYKKTRKCKTFGPSNEWWLRGCDMTGNWYVDVNGKINLAVDDIACMRAVRPAMWLDADTKISRESICSADSNTI